MAAEEAGDVYAEARNASALAIAYVQAGRFKKALGWLQFSNDRVDHPGLSLVTVNTQAYLQILTSDTKGLEGKLAALSEEIDGEVYSLQKTELRSTLADLYQATGRYNDALQIYRYELSQAPRARRSWLTHGYVRALCALRQQAEAQKQAEAAVSITDTLSNYHQQRARLALGISLWP